ncbi:MAG TPA: SWIM zinc finger family protein [Verrucomicrobiae bacterium]|nr:SWIM zinc finger family protein [Verrucomicrobiae bacterium]
MSPRWSRTVRDSWYPQPSVPLAADGIRARSQRGPIGESWWSRRFLAVLEALDPGARLERGRRYARQGQVLDLAVEPGEVRARVQGSRPSPYRVVLRLLTLADKDWERVEEAMVGRAAFLAKLLAGQMPEEIEQAFDACQVSLFPASRGDLVTDCSCPDWANPCKHVAAATYLLAEAFDRDPFLVLTWRGRSKAELLERLRARRRAAASSVGSAEGPKGAPTVRAPAPVVATGGPPWSWRDGGGFWAAGGDLAALRRPPRRAPAAGLVLRELEPPDLQLAGTPLPDLLAPAYAVFDTAADERGGANGAASRQRSAGRTPIAGDGGGLPAASRPRPPRSVGQYLPMKGGGGEGENICA